MKLIARDVFSLTNIECVIECQLSSFKMIVKVQNMHRIAPIRSIQQINKSLKSSDLARDTKLVFVAVAMARTVVQIHAMSVSDASNVNRNQANA
jgi:membrane protein YdbS with pleckstrin-like domain